MAAAFISRAIRKPVQSMKEIVLQLGKGELPEDKIPVTKNVIGEMENIQKSIRSLSNSGEKITLWGVTDLLRRFLVGWDLPAGVVVVDSDPRRAQALTAEAIPVFQPTDYKNHIKDSVLIVLFAPRYREEIVRWLEVKSLRKVAAHEFLVVGVGPYGEALN